MSLITKSYLAGFARAYPFFIPVFSTLFGITFQQKIPIYFTVYLITVDTILTYFLKESFRYVYSFFGVNNIPILGRGLRPKGAKYCGCFITEDNLEGITTSFGMPSGHSIVAMTTSIFWSLYILDNFPDNFNRKISLLTVNSMGILICLSRVLLNCHTIEQTIFGGIIGSILGKYGYKLWLYLK